MASTAFWDFVIIVTLSYLTYDKISHWNDYEHCYSPIQVFLLLTYGAFLVYLIVKRLKARPNLPCLIKKCVDITFYWIVTPLVLYITVQGIIWQIQNNTYTPSCLPESIDPSIVWLYIAGLIVLELALILMAIVQLTAWWRRRRVRILMSEPNFSDLHQSLLNTNQRSMNETLNNEAGLEDWSSRLGDVSPCDIVTICILSYLISDEISDWSDYESCHSPIQIFLLLTYGSFIVYLIVMHLKAQPNLPGRIKKCVNITLYWIIHPLFLYIMIQGNIWQIQNDTYTRSCVPDNKVPWICFWISALFLWDVVLILRTIAKLTAWSRRRRVQALMSESNSSMNVDLNNVVGLELTDLERIAKERFLKSITNLFQQDSCPICYEDYQNDVIIATLPGCEHVFHSHCINNWLLRNPLCPICRSNVRNNLLASMNYKVVQTELTADVSL